MIKISDLVINSIWLLGNGARKWRLVHLHLTVLRVRLATTGALIIMAVVAIEKMGSRSGVSTTVDALASRRVIGHVLPIVKAEHSVVGASLFGRLDASSSLLDSA